MSDNDPLTRVFAIGDRYVLRIRAEFYERWQKWPIDLAETEKHEVVGGLLARLVTLATQLASVPPVWNGHVAPLILRSMTDAYITLAWIFGDPVVRARRFIEYGLGQEKLQIELLRESIADEDDVPTRRLIEARESWVNSQQYLFLTEVNVGSWSGSDTRTMAAEAECLDLYRYAYTPFSSAVHNMWNHIGKYNLTHCTNPLHKYHRIPIDPDLGIEPDYLYRAAKYVQKGFDLFDEKTGVSVDSTSALRLLVAELNDFKQSIRQNEKDTPDMRDTS